MAQDQEEEKEGGGGGKVAFAKQNAAYNARIKAGIKQGKIV